MTVLYPNPCYNMICYKGTALYHEPIYLFQNGHAVSLKSQKLKYGLPNGFAEEWSNGSLGGK